MSDQNNVGIVGRANVTLDDDQVIATARSQRRFAVQHLMSAAYFSRQVAIIEQENTNQPFGPFFEDVLANATACVFASVASLEAYANEFYMDREANFPHLQSEVAQKFWELYERKPILEKFDLALLLKNRMAMDHSKQPIRDIKTLIELRNALTHFKPEWEDEKEFHAKLSRKLQGKFKPCKFLPNELAIFPLQWACHGCTEWAVNTCKVYLSAFDTACGNTSEWKKFNSRLLP